MQVYDQDFSFSDRDSLFFLKISARRVRVGFLRFVSGQVQNLGCIKTYCAYSCRSKWHFLFLGAD